MKTRSLALSIILVSGMAATAAMAAYGTTTPSAVAPLERPSADRSLQASLPALPSAPSETSTPAVGSSTGNRILAPDGSCHQAVWPYIPAHCMKNADPERIRKPVRIIRIDAVLPKIEASLPKAAVRGRQ